LTSASGAHSNESRSPDKPDINIIATREHRDGARTRSRDGYATFV
jgi:hypothetical protein